MNIQTVAKFLQERGYIWYSTGEDSFDGNLVALSFYLTKQDIAEIEVHSGEGNQIGSITINPTKNVFNWVRHGKSYDTFEHIHLSNADLYLLEYILDLLENDNVWEEHVKRYDELNILFRKQCTEYKDILTKKDYKVFSQVNGNNNEICSKKMIFGNRPDSLSVISLELDCLLLKIVLIAETDLGSQKYVIPFDGFYAKEQIHRIIATDDVWQPIMEANREKNKQLGY